MKYGKKGGSNKESAQLSVRHRRRMRHLRILASLSFLHLDYCWPSWMTLVLLLLLLLLSSSSSSSRNSDGLIDFDEFRAMDKAFPLLFFPAFKLQDSLQKQFLGAAGRIRRLVNTLHVDASIFIS